MGIKGFQSYMNKYPNRLLRNVQISNQYVVIDGSEILYTLYCDDTHYGRYKRWQIIYLDSYVDMLF